ncbi:MAG: exo-alpha-sialidase [bacterium]|nr:exo-alpha-sialidase [bacterium]
MRIVDQGTIAFHESVAGKPALSFPSLAVLPSGRCLCIFRAAPIKENVDQQTPCLTYSDDEGRTWTPPTQPWPHIDVDGRKGRLRCGGLTPLGGDRLLAVVMWVDATVPDRPFFNPETEGLLDCRTFLSTSEDAGATWSDLRLVDTTPYPSPAPITGPVLAFPDGELALQFELNKPWDDTSTWRHSSILMFSTDEGQSFPRHTVAANDPDNRHFYWDQRPTILPDGTMLNVFWTYDTQAATYLNIHARTSDDRGQTWSPLYDTGAPGQAAQPIALPDGRVVMAYMDRDGSPALRLRVSSDRGQTWPESTELTLLEPTLETQTEVKNGMADAWSEMGAFSFGLPHAAPLNDGSVIVCCYAGPHADSTSIEYVRIAG